VDECKPLNVGGPELATLLVEKGADVNAVGAGGGNSGTPLWWAALAAGAYTCPLFSST